MKYKKYFLAGAISSIMCCFLSAQGQRTPFNIDLLTGQMDTIIHSKPFDINDTDYAPFIRVFLPAKETSTGRAVLICPGGGYSMVASGHEGYRWAQFFNPKGIAVIVLKYRLPKGDYKIPMSDAETALKVVKDSASVWSIDPGDIGIMGFSAGGHLASTIATHSSAPLRPKFQILFYPVITMDRTYTHMGSHDAFLGQHPSRKMENLFSGEKQVTKDTPPAFIVLAADDSVVPPANGINYFRALIDHKIFATLHVYPRGNHGWGYSERYRYHLQTLNELWLWLNEIE